MDLCTNLLGELAYLKIMKIKPLSKWGEIFGDPVLANAILDRLLHHSHVINIVGRSYRTKNLISELEDDKHSMQVQDTHQNYSL